MALKTAWLVENGEDDLDSSRYRKFFPELNIDFFVSPKEVLSALDRDYGLFVLGLVTPIEPYEPHEVDDGLCTGIRLAADIRANQMYKDTPIIISSTQADLYSDEIASADLVGICRPWTTKEFRELIKQYS